MTIAWLLFGAVLLVWQAALAAFILSFRERGWRLSLGPLFAFVALQALLFGAFVTTMRLQGE